MLQSNKVHGGEVVNDLVGLHPLELLSREYLISPKDVPFMLLARLLAPRELPSKDLFCHALDYWIANFSHVEYQFRMIGINFDLGDFRLYGDLCCRYDILQLLRVWDINLLPCSF